MACDEIRVRHTLDIKRINKSRDRHALHIGKANILHDLPGQVLIAGR